ncbi:MAG: hypothetical protein JWM43_725 [Acidobacteriaceae bacterium]|nr:hypothetical protein [Acidobacteriaceae bacterium]
MKLDIVVPTYNRSGLLRKTIASLLAATVPDGLEVQIIVVDNNSSDDTEQVAREYPVQYVRERMQGLSSARNGGIAAGTGDLIGFIDDDEEVAKDWIEVVYREFQDPSVQFIGGPYLPNWSAASPNWLPPGYNAAIGIVTAKQRGPMDAAFQGNLMGGNAVMRRSVFDKVGLYSAKLGRSGKGLLSEEDAEFYGRLKAAKIHGLHVPDLLILHYIPESRLTRSYHRKWAYWRAVSQGYLAREVREPVPYLLGVPRYMIGRAAKNMVLAPKYLLQGASGKAFAAELSVWDLVGFAYGRHVIDLDKYYAAAKG